MCRQDADGSAVSAPRGTFDVYGYAVVPKLLDSQRIKTLIQLIEPECRSRYEQSGRDVHAIRHLFDVLPAMKSIITWPEIRSLVEPALGSDAFAVRAIYFDKLPGANWKVPWHQDQTIAVKSRIDVPLFGPWSVKEGVPHVEPPISVLERMLTVRIHLDDCTEDNGPLRVIPGSHKLGRQTPDDARGQLDKHGEVACAVKSGGAVLMRPMLLHASSPSVSSMHRRVIHIEFAADQLPSGLEWAGPIVPIRK
jgi:ectoine hydroxylase-related dioxygenase (phytanoyl-CoA dioxygenase family)